MAKRQTYDVTLPTSARGGSIMAGLTKPIGNKHPRIARVFIILIARAGFESAALESNFIFKINNLLDK